MSWVGQKQHLLWRRISQSEIRKIAAAKKEATKTKAGKNSFPPIAVGVGFEPTVPLLTQQFSRLPPSTAQSPHLVAEEVGVEPTNRFLHGYSLANCWLTIRRTPPYFLHSILNLIYFQPKLSQSLHFIFFNFN